MEDSDKKHAKQRRAEQENAEKKLQELYNKRNALNEEAKAFREERDQLNGEKKRLFGKIDTLKVEREKAFEMLNIHKAKRDAYQTQARELIKAKRAKAGDKTPTLFKDVSTLKTSIQEKEWAHQTTPMSVKKEKDLLDILKKQKEELKEKEAELSKQMKLKGIIGDMDGNITEMFGQADAEHVYVQKFYSDARAYKKEMDATFAKIKELGQMSDKAHHKFLSARERADETHQKALEMREQVMGYRKEAWEERKKAKELISEQNKSVKKALEDKDKLEEAAEDSLKALLQQGKIKL